MSGMKLRDSIRAPVRYGEDDFDESRRTSLRYECDDFFDDSVELGESGRPRPQKRRKPNTVPYNPNLPPATFPSLDRPQPGRNSTTPRQNCDVGDRKNNGQMNGILLPHSDQMLAPDLPPGMEEAPMSCFENHVASNNMDNPVYARNVGLVSVDPSNATDFEGMMTSSDSDDDPQPDATQALLDSIPNPKWNDLHPAMQVEIIENAMKHHSWRRLCDLLHLGPDERTKFMDNLSIRNKQIERENKRLSQMRLKQRNALMRIDNSDLKLFDPPPQLVLKKIAKDTTRSLLTMYTDLLMCQSHDVLKARQYLHQHGLPRRYAGDWGDSLVVLRESEDSLHEPDRMEWTENPRITPPPNEIESPIYTSQTLINSSKATAIESFSVGNTINPNDLGRRSTDPEPIVDWGKYFEQNPDSSWNTEKPRLGGFVKLNVDSQKAAQIQQEKSSPPPEFPDTPSKAPHNSVAQRARPFSRVLTEHWPPKDGSSASQARYRQSIQQAKLEKIEAKSKAMRQQYNSQPALRVDSVGAGIRFPSQPSQPRPMNPPRSRIQPVRENVPSNLNDLPSNFFSRAHRGMTMRNIDHIMDEFICFEPIVPPKENGPEQRKEEAAENADEQPSSTDTSLLTDLSMDDVMLVPTDRYSSSQ